MGWLYTPSGNGVPGLLQSLLCCCGSDHVGPCRNVRDEIILCLIMGRKPFPNCIIILFISFCWRSVFLHPSRRLPLRSGDSCQDPSATANLCFAKNTPVSLELCMVWRHFGSARNKITNYGSLHPLSLLNMISWPVSGWIRAMYRLLWALQRNGIRN